MRVGTHDCAPDDAACSRDCGEGGDAINGDRRPAKYLTIDDDGQGTDDAAGNLGKKGGERNGMDRQTGLA
jgi:hypothetical protein